MTTGLTGWKKKYKLINPNTGVLDGHKTYVNVYWKRGMRKDFRDIRFTDKKGNLLPHYLLMYTDFTWAQFWVWLPPCSANPVLYCHFGNGAVKSASSFSGIQGLFVDYFETGLIDTEKWAVKETSYISVDIKTDYKYNNYSLGLDYSALITNVSSYDIGHALMKIPLTSMAVGSRTFIFVLARRGTTSSAANFLGFGTGENSSGSCIYDLPKDSTWHDYLIKVYRSASSTWDFYIMKDGVLDASITGVSRTYTTYFYLGLQTWASEWGGAVDDHAWIDSVIAYLEPPAGWFNGYPSGLSWGQRCLIPYRKSPYSQTITAETSASLTAELAGYKDSLVYSVPGLKISKPQFAFGTPDPIDDNSTGLTFSKPEATITDFEGLEDFALVSCEVKKGINDSYWTLTGTCLGSLVPGADAIVKFNVVDPDAVSHILFYGKMQPSRPAFGFLGDSVAIEAADFAQNLAIQKIPWDARLISLAGTYTAWDSWINYLCNFSGNNLVPRTINRPATGTTEIGLDAKASRLEAIKKICEYTGYLFITKLVNTGTIAAPLWRTGVYFLAPGDIDSSLNLPSPVTLTAPDASLLDAPGLEPDLENNYNMVTVYGTLSSDGLFYTMSACTPGVALGRETAREYRYEDNLVYEKETTFELEAIKWLLYFSTRQATVKMKFIDRFDFELFQRVKFGEGYNTALQGLTNLLAFTTVRVYDPQDPLNYQDIDVSGVPRPSWLRITDISYSCQNLQNIVSITAKTDWIYSNSDPFIDPAFSQYIGSGYYKPEIEDSTSTTQGMIDNSISKQPSAQKGTILSVSTDGKTAEVQTADGKTITAAVVSEATVGANVLVIPGSSGYYIS